MSAETAGRPLKISELPLKTDLVVWIPLSNYQKEIYRHMLANQDITELLSDKKFINAFFYLSYMKKICIHPYLL